MRATLQSCFFSAQSDGGKDHRAKKKNPPRTILQLHNRTISAALALLLEKTQVPHMGRQRHSLFSKAICTHELYFSLMLSFHK